MTNSILGNTQKTLETDGLGQYLIFTEIEDSLGIIQSMAMRFVKQVNNKNDKMLKSNRMKGQNQ